MAESEEESAPKILVRAPTATIGSLVKTTIPEKVHSNDPNLQPRDPDLVGILTDTNNNLASHFHEANPGVKVGITVLDF